MSDIRSITDKAKLALAEADANKPSRAEQFASRLLTVPQLLTWRPPPILVADVLFLGTLAIIYGPPGASKSFLALDLALCVAGGIHWQGREVRGGGALYVAAEGGVGLGVRVNAWVTAYDEVPERFLLFPDAVNLLDRTQADVITEWAIEHRPSLVVLDTLARSMVGGDENAAQDMGLAVDAADQIRTASGATVVLVHHSTKDGVSLRGSSALLGAADTVMEVRSDEEIVTVECRKQKDAEQFEKIRLQRHVVELEAGSSCVLRALRPLQQQTAAQRHQDAIVAELNATYSELGASAKELREALDMQAWTLSKAVNPLLKAGKVINSGTKKRPHYQLPRSMLQGKES